MIDDYKELVRQLVRKAEISNMATLTGLAKLKRVSLWGFLTPSAQLLSLLSIRALEFLDLRGCGVRGSYGIGNQFFKAGSTAANPLGTYLGLKGIRIEDLNNDEIRGLKAYYQGSFAKEKGFPITGQFIEKEAEA
jgi:hypothetical protein